MVVFGDLQLNAAYCSIMNVHHETQVYEKHLWFCQQQNQIFAHHITVLAISQNILHIHPYIKIMAVMGLVARSY